MTPTAPSTPPSSSLRSPSGLCGPCKKWAIFSSVGRKYLMALTGLGLVGFVIAHLAGNFLLYLPNGTAFNRYALKLEELGPLLKLAEVGLFLMFLVHIVFAIQLKIQAKGARPQGYARFKTKGGPSKTNLASLNMVISGILLLAFVIYHIKHLRLGPGIAEGYVTEIDGKEARDLYALVVESFQKTPVAMLYMSAMVFLGLHLRHGFWSAFQSLGLAYPRYSKHIYCLGLFLAVLLALGFLGIPLWIYFDLSGVLL